MCGKTWFKAARVMFTVLLLGTVSMTSAQKAGDAVVPKRSIQIYANETREAYEMPIGSVGTGDLLRIIQVGRSHFRIRTQSGIEGYVQKSEVQKASQHDLMQAEAEAQRQAAEKQARLNELLRQKQELEQNKAPTKAETAKQAEQKRPKGQELEVIIERHENLLRQCETRKTDRCADVMYTLGSLYFDQASDETGAAQEKYALEMAQWERQGGRGNPPKAPPVAIANYSKSLQMYWRLTREYPLYPKLPEAFFQMANNYMLSGHLDTTKIIFESLVTRFPNSPRVSGAHFRLGELTFMDDQFNKAYEHFKKVKRDQVDPVTWEMTHYRSGECAYNTGRFDKAAEYFHSYIVECDANRYQRKDFRNMALEYLAITFSDMENGVLEAIKFFEKHKGKSYEEQVVYMIGMKNKEHGQWSAAIFNLEGALKKYPNYKDAPIARRMLAECYEVTKDFEKAKRMRESADGDGAGSKTGNN